jgi:hypothetical protein
VNYDSALNKQRIKNQGATPIAGAPLLTRHFMQWWAARFAERFGSARIADPTTTMRRGNTVWKIPQYALEHVNDPSQRYVEVWAPAHIMRQSLGCDIYVLGVPNGH